MSWDSETAELGLNAAAFQGISKLQRLQSLTVNFRVSCLDFTSTCTCCCKSFVSQILRCVLQCECCQCFVYGFHHAELCTQFCMSCCNAGLVTLHPLCC